MVNPQPVIALVGTLDTKGHEYEFLRQQVEAAGGIALVVDAGVLGAATVAVDVSREEVARAGGGELADLQRAANRGESMQVMARGIARVLEGENRVGALLVVGGSNAGYLMAAVSESLPIGFPKLLVSTIAAGDTKGYIRDTDLTLMYPVVDINGLNRLTRPILTNAARAAVGMAATAASPAGVSDAPLVGISMFGVTTACGTAVAEGLEPAGVESLTFHATGVGGRTLEKLIRNGYLQAVADLTTTELADDLVGGVCTAGPERLTAAAETGTPQVVSVGALDMVNFWGRETVPERFAGRLFFEHNPTVTLMRTSVEECSELGRRLAEKLNRSTGKCEVIFPRRGVSQISVPGGPFHDAEADRALLTSIREHLRPGIPLHEFDTDINDPQIAATAVDLLTNWLKEGPE